MKVKKYALVYQGGIANVFEVKCFNLASFGRDARRVLQSDFSHCEHYAKGLGEAGAKVATYTCNQAGDIAKSRWSDDLEAQPFSESFRPVFVGVKSSVTVNFTGD